MKAQRPAPDTVTGPSTSSGQTDGTLAVLDASPNPIIAVDADARITYLNAQVEIAFGYRRDELLGQPIEILLPPGVVERHVEQRGRFMEHPVARPTGVGLDLAGRRKDGSEFPVEISLAPIDTADGLRVFATVVDITTRKIMEGQLLQAQKLESVGRLAGGIAHDFNNVLFAITGYAELLTDDLSPERREQLDPDEALRSVQAIALAATRAASLTTQLLTFSRRQVVRPEVFDLNSAIEGAEPMLRRLVGETIRLVVRPGAGTGRLRADHGQLDQILVNLAINARDAMPEGGSITIESGNIELDESYADLHVDVKPGSYVYLAVTDTGPGMDPATREHAFEPFFTTKEPGHGSGLGLATTYGIVQQAGGHIWLYSEPGIGSSFKIYFPRVDAPASPVSPDAPGRAQAGGGTLMVVEDESSVRDMTSIVLRRAGYTVTSVADGAQALERLGEMTQPIDVLVSDVVMPGMSGIDLAERVLDDYPAAGVVLLSGYTAETLDLDRVVTRGALFLSKPVNATDLIDAVRRSRDRRLMPEGVAR